MLGYVQTACHDGLLNLASMSRRRPCFDGTLGGRLQAAFLERAQKLIAAAPQTAPVISAGPKTCCFQSQTSQLEKLNFQRLFLPNYLLILPLKIGCFHV